MKKLLPFLFAAITALILAACTTTTTTPEKEVADNAIDVYTTVYPLQYFTDRIGAEYVNVKSIYPTGANEHSFEPTQKAMIDLADADLFFYIGLGLEGFVEKAEKTLKDENVQFVPTANALTAEQLAISTGHVHTEDEAHDHGHDHDHEGEEEAHENEEIDAHVWLSPVLSKELATAIKNQLIATMPEHEAYFTQNYETLVQELDTLNTEFEQMAANVKNKTFFVSHAAFGYIAGHYGFTQVPIAGLNSQSEPSQKELAQIVDLAKEKNIKDVFFEQNVSSNLASVIQDEIGAEARTLHNLSVLTEEDVKNNKDYFSLMRDNLESLEEALNK